MAAVRKGACVEPGKVADRMMSVLPRT